MFRQLLEPDGLLTDAYHDLLAEKPRGYRVTAKELYAHYEVSWCVVRNQQMEALADQYADRFFDLLASYDVLDQILERLQYIDVEYEQTIVSAELPETPEDIARTAAMCLQVMAIRRLEERGEVVMLTEPDVAVWLKEHAARLGDKHGQLSMF